MITNMENIFEKTVIEPNKEKIQNGINLSNCQNLTKEYITEYLMLSDKEYSWLAAEFNRKNVDTDYKYDTENPKNAYYEQTISYKIKHPIVVTLRKIGIYDRTKRLLGRVGLQ